MNYRDDKLKNALSSHYVLGTLSGRARARYQRLVQEHSDVRQTLWRWEQHLNGLGGSLPEAPPDEKVWRSIQARLGFVPPQPAPRPRRWTLLTGLALAASVAFAALLLWTRPQAPAPYAERVAVVQNAEAQALWLIQIRKDNLGIAATANVAPYSDKDYELWMLTKDGRAPVSLGLLPQQGKRDLARPALFDEVEIAALAVSLEPLGGSPNGQPTTVLFTTELMAL